MRAGQPRRAVAGLAVVQFIKKAIRGWKIIAQWLAYCCTSELGGLGEWSADCERARGTAKFYKPRHALWLSGMDDEDR